MSHRHIGGNIRYADMSAKTVGVLMSVRKFETIVERVHTLTVGKKIRYVAIWEKTCRQSGSKITC